MGTDQHMHARHIRTVAYNNLTTCHDIYRNSTHKNNARWAVEAPRYLTPKSVGFGFNNSTGNRRREQVGTQGMKKGIFI